MNVVVVGHSIAGRMSAALLSQLPHIAHVTVLEAAAASSSSLHSSSSASSIHVGLWTPALCCLRDHLRDPDILIQLFQREVGMMI